MADQLFDYAKISQMVVSETIQQAWADMENSGLKDNLQGIQQAASTFLAKVKVMHEKIVNVSQMQKSIYKIYQTTNANRMPDANGLAALRNMKDMFAQLGNLSDYNNACMAFQNQLNWYYGQVIVILYTGNDWSIHQNLNVGEHLRKELASKGRGVIQRYRTSALRQGEKMTPQDQAALDRINDLKSVAEEINWRLQHSNKKLGLHYLLLWIPSGDWKLAWIGNMGDVREAYTALALQSEIRLNGNMEQKIDTFVNAGLENVDNASGILLGDFNINKIMFAVKSLSASAMSYEGLISIAEQIVAQGDALTAEYMQNIYTQFTSGGHTRQVQKNYQRQLEKHGETMESAIDKIVDQEFLVHLGLK